MDIKKLIGIISSISLIIIYIGNLIIDFTLYDKIQVVEFYDTIGRLIFTISLIGFYYSLSKYLSQYGYKTETKILNSLIILALIVFIINGIQYYYGIIPGFIQPIFNIAVVILLMVFGIRILKLKDELFINLKSLKTFIILLFIVWGLVIVSAAFMTLNHRFELMNVAYSIFAIPYIFGLMYFLKDKEEEKQKQPAVNSKYSP